MTVICGIGSRQTPPTILQEMIKIGNWTKCRKIWLRSGHAEGADWSFEQGSQRYCIAYLPWVGFNKHLVSNAQFYIPEESRWLNSLVWTYHPKAGSLSQAAFKLMRRNGCQVLGKNGDNPSKVVICWTTNWKKPSGGTSQAIRIANAYSIPVINMQNPLFDTADKVINELSKLC